MSIGPHGICAKGESSTSTFYEDLGISMHRIKNVIIKNNEEDFIKFDETIYLMPTFIPYGHALIDCYSQYNAIKNKDSNVRIVFYDLNNLGYSLESNPTKNVIKDLMFLSGESERIDISKNNFIFSEIVLFFDYTDTFLEEFYLNSGIDKRPHYPPFCKCYQSGSDPCGTNESWKYNIFAINYLKNSFNEYKSVNNNRKFYISRRIVNEKNLTSLKNDPDNWIAKSRSYHSENLIENLFIENGFEIIIPDNMSLLEQIKLFSQASHIAGISGIGLLNMVWADKPKVYEICVNPFYDYHHKEYGIQSGVVEYFKIDCRSLNVQDTVDKINQYLI